MNQPDCVEVFRLALPMDVGDFNNTFLYLQKRYKTLGYDKLYMRGHYDEYGRNFVIFTAYVFPPVEPPIKEKDKLKIEFTTTDERP